ncbi:MAG: hypothetical protein J6I45_08530 [Clostridia bacterium]|nr:hypothetical protein [Clostridia bacterium]
MSAVKHDYQHKYTDTEHWTECIFCHDSTEKMTHKMSEWKTIVKPGYTFAGEKQRTCKICGYAVRESISTLILPENKYVVIIPDYSSIGDVAIDAPDISTNQPLQEKDPSIVPSSGASAATPDASVGQLPSDNSEAASPSVKELLTKGSENTVPALPTLPPKEDGNIFEGWIDKATGEPVNKGDKLTGNVELEPVWKDCGEDKHKDANENNHCDACGYILVKDVKPVETTNNGDDISSDTEHEDEIISENNDGVPSGMIIVILCFGGVIAICGIILAVCLKKKK